MGDSAFHFRCRIGKGKRSFGLYFSMGAAHVGKTPTAEDVLDCIASDASGYENAADFRDWAGDYGYDEDSRTAEKLFRTVKRQAEQLRRTVGEEAYSDLLWNCERL